MKKYEFISRSNIINSGSRGKRIWLNIGILSLGIALVLELLIGKKFGIVFILPLMYLIKARTQIGNKYIYADVPICIECCETYINILFVNTFIYNGKIYSLQYHIDKNNIVFVELINQANIIKINFRGKQSVVDQNGNTVKSKKEKRHTLQMYIPNKFLEDIAKELNIVCDKTM